MSIATIVKQIGNAPPLPGIYLFKDSNKKVIYVGKAGNLRNRLTSYTVSANSLEPKTQQLVKRIADFEFIVTESETEALILENNFIKKLQPRYNSRLKDDRTYPYIKITLNENFPQVIITRKLLDDGARYFGPYPSSSSVRKIMAVLKKLFPYRSCNREITGRDSRACLEYHIKRCIAPCIGIASQEQYRSTINQVVMFMEGKTRAVVKELKTNMEQSSRKLEYERASIFRDQITAIKKITENQKVFSIRGNDQDVIGMSVDSVEAWIEIFFIRDGKLIGRDNFIMSLVNEDDPSAVITGFVKQYYHNATHIPPRIILQHNLQDSKSIKQWLEGKSGRRVDLRVPRRGPALGMLNMVVENAQSGFQQLKFKRLTNSSRLEQAIEDLQEKLSLPRPPKRIECYDISNTQGTNPVGSMVVFENGQAKPSLYRRFKIKTINGIDDYSMMQEVLRRRFDKISVANAHDRPVNMETDHTNSSQGWTNIPDLVLIDGGKGHLNAILEVFLDMGIDYVPLASLAKGQEEIFLTDTQESIMLPRNSQSLFLVQRLRDEAHRFAITYHKHRRNKNGMKSILDSITGIGTKRKRLLLRKYGSVNAIIQANTEDIASIPGMTLSVAKKLKESI